MDFWWNCTIPNMLLHTMSNLLCFRLYYVWLLGKGPGGPKHVGSSLKTFRVEYLQTETNLNWFLFLLEFCSIASSFSTSRRGEGDRGVFAVFCCECSKNAWYYSPLFYLTNIVCHFRWHSSVLVDGPFGGYSLQDKRTDMKWQTIVVK